MQPYVLDDNNVWNGVCVCMDRQGKMELERVYLRSVVVSLELNKSFRYSMEYY